MVPALVGALMGASGIVRAARTSTPQAAVDPFALQQRINRRADVDVAAVWDSLGLPSRLDTATAPVFTRCRECVATISREHLDADPAGQVVLHVCEPYGLCRFLFFQRHASAWKLIGHADHDISRHGLPTHEIRALRGRRFFVMHAEATYGTGISLWATRWFELAGTTVREVLVLPERGTVFLSARSPGRTFRTDVSDDMSDGDGDRLDVTFSVDYTADYALVDPAASETLPLFSRVAHATYARRHGQIAFSLDEQQSTITRAEIGAVFAPDDIGCADFLRFNGVELSALAARATGHTSAWLRQYLASCPSNADRANLIRPLDR